MTVPFSPRDLIFVSLEDWDDIWRRNQFLCDALARRHPQMRILFVGLPRDISRGLRQGTLLELRAASRKSVSGLPNLTVIKPLKLLPNSIPATRWINDWMARRQIKSEARRLKMVAPILWLNPNSAGHLIGKVGERRVVYDITDDWELADASASKRAAIRRYDRDLCRRADLVIVCSSALAESRRGVSARMLLLPNGVDTSHYQRVTELHRHAETGDGRPVLGYTGTLHADRIDIDMILAVSAAFPNGTIYLVGPDCLTEPDRARLHAASNIRLTGPMPYADLPAMMARFDACIVPHRVSPFTQSLNPIKLWEYLAAGKPIVSTPVAGFSDYPALCRLARTSDEFISGCRDAIAEGNSRTAARRAVAEQNTWAARVDRLEEELKAISEPADGDDPVRWTTGRVIVAVSRRFRLYRARLLNRRIRFGARCDIGPAFRAKVGPRGYVALDEGCVIDRGMTIESVGTVQVGCRCIFGHNCTLSARGAVSIGEGCMFAEMVSVRDHDHRSADPDQPYRSQGYDVRPVSIGKNVWLGAKVSVLKGVSIGDNTVVGAHAVVTRDLPANSVAVGVPARVIRQRNQA